MKSTILILLFALGTLLISCNDAEDKAWQAAVAQNTDGAIDSFLQIYPESKYKTAAKEQKDNYAWYWAEQTNTVYGYKKYLSDFPEGLYQEEVPNRLQSITVEEISLADLTKSSFVGKIDYGSRETQIIAFKFVEIQEDEKNIRFTAQINTSEIRKSIEGRIDKNDYTIMFTENPAQKGIINLTDGKIYKRANKFLIESANISQYWKLLKYHE
jgi:hypothetical protein